jgi:heat shock protein HtpX
MNRLKAFLLMTLLTIMLVGIGAILGGKSGMTIALLMAFGMNFITYWFSDKIVLRMYGARPILEGVIGHELAHIQHRDILISTMVTTIAWAITYLAQMAQWSIIFGVRRKKGEEGGGLISTIIMMIVGPIAAMLVQMAISRSRKYGANSGGAWIAGNPRYLADALRKMERAAQQIPMNANPATAQMFIVNPLSGGGLLRLFSTHPPMEERIARLESMKSGV